MFVEVESGVQLTDKELQFCEAYAIDFNGSKAARIAGYSEDRNADSIKQMAATILKKPHIKTHIAHLRTRTSELAKMTALRNVLELKKIAFEEDDDGKPIGRIINISDRLKAIEILNKMLGFNAPDQVEHSGEVSIPIIQWVK